MREPGFTLNNNLKMYRFNHLVIIGIEPRFRNMSIRLKVCDECGKYTTGRTGRASGRSRTADPADRPRPQAPVRGHGGSRRGPAIAGTAPGEAGDRRGW